MAEAPDNRRIARNALMLTLRMVLVTIVGLYTSRVVLATLEGPLGEAKLTT